MSYFPVFCALINISVAGGGNGGRAEGRTTSDELKETADLHTALVRHFNRALAGA